LKRHNQISKFAKLTKWGRDGAEPPLMKIC
jgi:hypothetical protein